MDDIDLIFPPRAPVIPNKDVEVDFYPLIRIFKDGKVERFVGTDTIPTGTDPTTGVQSKDVILSSEDGVGARLYLPKNASPEKKLPVLVYFHGGGFWVGTAWCPVYHIYLNSLVAKANVVAVSVNYRLAPEHVLPTAFEDSWSVFKWVASHSGSGSLKEPEPWLMEYVNFNKIFFSGDSAGANIAHNIALKVGMNDLPGIKLEGIILIHPFFSGVELVGNESDLPVEVLNAYEKVWKVVYPGMSGLDDPVINPFKDLERTRKVGYERVLVCIATKDPLASRGVEYGEVMRKCGKEVEVFKSEEMPHVFHFFDRFAAEGEKMMNKVVQFIKGESTNE